MLTNASAAPRINRSAHDADFLESIIDMTDRRAMAIEYKCEGKKERLMYVPLCGAEFVDRLAGESACERAAPQHGGPAQSPLGLVYNHVSAAILENCVKKMVKNLNSDS
jgi:hypothetical protein